ncbi:hypothetical protein EV426DRAFT_594757 [Tirmania nivea]|nr:hypothetical protein EV426DRAFT_594757 [Tirmania nivea]
MEDEEMTKAQEDEDFVDSSATLQVAIEYPINESDNPKVGDSLDKWPGGDSENGIEEAPSSNTKKGISHISSDLIARSISLPELVEREESAFQDVTRLPSVLKDVYYNPSRGEDKMLPISRPQEELETSEPPVAMFLGANNGEDYLIPMSVRDKQLQLLKRKKLVKAIKMSVEKPHGRPISMFMDGDPFPPYITSIMGFRDKYFRLRKRKDRKRKDRKRKDRKRKDRKRKDRKERIAKGLDTAKKRGKPLKKPWKELQHGPPILPGYDQDLYSYCQQYPWNSKQRRGGNKRCTHTLSSRPLKQYPLGLEKTRGASLGIAPRCTGKDLRVIKSPREPNLMKFRTKLDLELSRWPTLQALIERQIVFVTLAGFRIGITPGDSKEGTWLHEDFINQVYNQMVAIDGVTVRDIKAAGYGPTRARTAEDVFGNSTMPNIDSVTLLVQKNINTDNGLYAPLRISLPQLKELWQVPRSDTFSYGFQSMPAGIGGASGLGLRGGTAMEAVLSEDSTKNLITNVVRDSIEEERALSGHRAASEFERPDQIYQIGNGELRASPLPLRNPFGVWEVDEDLEDLEDLEALPEVPLWKAMIDVIFSMWKGLEVFCFDGLGGGRDYRTARW